jgi:hypothetical protein
VTNWRRVGKRVCGDSGSLRQFDSQDIDDHA